MFIYTQWRHNTRDWSSTRLYLKGNLELSYHFSMVGSNCRGTFITTIIPLILWMHCLCTSELIWRKTIPFINWATLKRSKNTSFIHTWIKPTKQRKLPRGNKSVPGWWMQRKAFDNSDLTFSLNYILTMKE